MTATAKAPLATTPCNRCGEPIVFVSVRDGAGHRKVALDPTLPVFLRIAEDPDTEPRSAFWIEARQPAGERPVALARHRCAPRDQ